MLYLGKAESILDRSRTLLICSIKSTSSLLCCSCDDIVRFAYLNYMQKNEKKKKRIHTPQATKPGGGIF